MQSRTFKIRSFYLKYSHRRTMDAKLQELRNALGELNDDENQFVDCACLDRYLRACCDNIEKAAAQLKLTLHWRRTFKPDLKLTPRLEQMILKEKTYVAGVASDGFPIIITRKRTHRLLPEEEDDYIRLLTYTSEVAIRSMKENVEQWIWILDLKGYTSRNSPKLSVTKRAASLLSDHFPERLKKAFIVDAPKIFYVLYKLVYPFLDEQTQKKIAFVYTSDYDATTHRPLPEVKDPFEFDKYFEFHLQRYDPVSYLESLREQENGELL